MCFLKGVTISDLHFIHTGNVIHLNNAGSGLMSDVVTGAQFDFIKQVRLYIRRRSAS